jgi:hypothetical protein
MTWTNQSYAFGSLLTSTKMGLLYDNLTAFANGDSGAPQIYMSDAMQDPIVGDGACYYHRSFKHASPVYVFNVGSVFQDSVQTSFNCRKTGNYTVGLQANFEMDLLGSYQEDTMEAALLVNSVQVGAAATVTTTSYSSAVFSAFITNDIAINSGDVVAVGVKRSGSHSLIIGDINVSIAIASGREYSVFDFNVYSSDTYPQTAVR